MRLVKDSLLEEGVKMDKVVLALIQEVENKLKELKEEYEKKVTVAIDLEVCSRLSSVGMELQGVLVELSRCVKGE